ncbi:type IV toxin-antitoxin system AbiEi family antitoxin [Chromobacterium vaccinii]|nr:type IV toxin-antitoxin system AbiEi family antitoxin [Chromobacterium vaccinii]
MHDERSIVQQLMSTAPRGRPLDTALLADLGINVDIASSLAHKGWLTELQPRVYLMRGDSPSLDGTICYLATLVDGLHVAERTALHWRGVRHNVYFREPIFLWGIGTLEIPSWATRLFPITYRSAIIFDEQLEYSTCLSNAPGRHPEVLVSSTERAVFELISTCQNPDLHEGVRNLLMLLRNIRLPILQDLAGHCVHRDTVLLLKELADQEGLPWASKLRG